jgi:hypothetical protein
MGISGRSLSGMLAVDVERQSPVPGLDRYLAKRSITRIRSAHDFAPMSREHP